VRIDDDGNWHDLPCGEVGNLVIGGPTVFPGYVSHCSSEGFASNMHHVLDLIIRGGHNDPAMVEDALLAHPEVTAAGKPFKLPLRADAARNAIRDALAGYAGSESVDATVEGGSTEVTVTLDPDADREVVAQAVGRYPVRARFEVKRQPGGPVVVIHNTTRQVMA
jgi:hypothetical protein